MSQKVYNPVVLLICDGFGIAPDGPGNAISQANMPNFKNYMARYPHGQLNASGEAVGLVPGEVGSTEVGHLNLGAGRIVYQDLPRINMSIAEGTFLEVPAFLQAVNHVRQNNGSLHLMGLVSTGNVHASIEHLFALLWFAKNQGLEQHQVKIHAFLDGRDTPPTSALMFISQLQDKINTLRIGQIATISGRYYAMDRDNRWDRIEKAYNAIALGIGEKALSANAAIADSYLKGITDEFIVPTIITDDLGNPIGSVNQGDAIIHFNYRTDRPRELAKAFVVEDFQVNTFTRQSKIQNLFFVTMTEFEKDLQVNGIAFPQEKIQMPLARILTDHDKRHLHIAE